MRKALMTLAITGSLFAQAPVQYPETRKDAVVDDYFGTKVADPYRWLEDDNSAETKAWVQAQNKVAFGYLNAIPGRDAIQARLTKLYNYEKYSAPFQQGGRYFYSYNKGLEPQATYQDADLVLHLLARTGPSAPPLARGCGTNRPRDRVRRDLRCCAPRPGCPRW